MAAIGSVAESTRFCLLTHWRRRSPRTKRPYPFDCLSGASREGSAFLWSNRPLLPRMKSSLRRTCCGQNWISAIHWERSVYDDEDDDWYSGIIVTTKTWFDHDIKCKCNRTQTKLNNHASKGVQIPLTLYSQVQKAQSPNLLWRNLFEVVKIGSIIMFHLS